MGAYEQFTIKEEELYSSQIQALNEHIIITEDAGMFRVLIDEEKSAVLFKPKPKSPFYVEIIDQCITATNVKWKRTFRSMLRKNKIKFRSKSLD